MFRKLKEKYQESPNTTVFVWAILATSFGVFCVGLFSYVTESTNFVELMEEGILLVAFFCPFFVYPTALTIQNMCQLCNPHMTDRNIRTGKITDRITILWGAVCTFLYSLIKIRPADWTETLVNDELHSPIATWTFPTLLFLAVIALLGYLVLRYIPIRKLPPLVSVLALAALCLGAGLCLLFLIQFAGREPILCVYPANLLLVAAKAVRYVCCQHEDAKKWPWIGFLLMWPLLGAAVAFLILFGQRPDSIIQAWTQTSDWTLSAYQAPPNVQVHMDYLCTVAAGGHPRLVKPVRMGERYGQRIVVNRQLMVTNAFEELLAEKLPGVHRRVRKVYDAVGYPLAKRVRNRWTADVVYFLMKPMEWFCLICLYLFEARPENRIAIQYLGKTKEDLQNCI